MDEDLRRYLGGVALAVGLCSLGLGLLLTLLGGGLFPYGCPCPPSTISNPLGTTSTGVTYSCSCPGISPSFPTYTLVAIGIGVGFLLIATDLYRKRD